MQASPSQVWVVGFRRDGSMRNVKYGMRRVFIAGALIMSVVAGCADDVEDERVVQVDYRHDEFASHYWRFFPSSIEVHAGETIVFRQQWTGEPHTVTMGTLVEKAIDEQAAFEEKYKDFDPATADPETFAKVEAEYDALGQGVPIVNPYGDPTRAIDSNQNALQPCFLDSGAPPPEPETPCRASDQEQPAFDGTQTFYSSGFIPFEGDEGNRFTVRLAEDIEPGTYRYICVLHMPDMQGAIVVTPEDEDLPSATERNRATQREIERLARPLREAYQSMLDDGVNYRGMKLSLPLGGYHAGDNFTVAIDEFVPRTIRTRIGDPVKWTLIGAHTVSFDVPEYLPIFTVGSDGLVKRNLAVDRSAQSPDPPPADFSAGQVNVDGGTWDGEGFLSSGLIAGEPFATYTLRFSKAGSYEYACVVHPPMVGRVVVES